MEQYTGSKVKKNLKSVTKIAWIIEKLEKEKHIKSKQK